MKAHHIHFLILVAILGTGIITFFSVRNNSSTQLAVGVVTTVAYVCWGVIHHAIQKDLHQRVVVEYILVGLIAIMLLVTVLGS